VTTEGMSAVVSSFALNGDTYQFALPVEAVEPAISIEPVSISQADVANKDKGFTVNGVGFAAESTITISFRTPDGTPFEFSTAEAVVTDANGAFTIEHVYLTSTSGVIPAGVFTVVATDAAGTSREATVTVTGATTAATPTTPPTAKKALAATGLDNGPLYLSAGLGMLLMGLAAFGITVARRRTA
jgi:hypothetical protein